MSRPGSQCQGNTNGTVTTRKIAHRKEKNLVHASTTVTPTAQERSTQAALGDVSTLWHA